MSVRYREKRMRDQRQLLIVVMSATGVSPLAVGLMNVFPSIVPREQILQGKVSGTSVEVFNGVSSHHLYLTKQDKSKVDIVVSATEAVELEALKGQCVNLNTRTSAFSINVKSYEKVSCPIRGI
jgi:hypothetical protein